MQCRAFNGTFFRLEHWRHCTSQRVFDLIDWESYETIVSSLFVFSYCTWTNPTLDVGSSAACFNYLWDDGGGKKEIINFFIISINDCFKLTGWNFTAESNPRKPFWSRTQHGSSHTHICASEQLLPRYTRTNKLTATENFLTAVDGLKRSNIHLSSLMNWRGRVESSR